jgi:hypothetical protein
MTASRYSTTIVIVSLIKGSKGWSLPSFLIS